MNIFRIPYILGRMSPVTYYPDPAYLAGITAAVDHITSTGSYAVLDTHNFGRNGGTLLQYPEDVAEYWTIFGAYFKDNPHVIFGCQNEFHDQSLDMVVQLVQGCINGIRASGALSQYIFVSGDNFTAASSWIASGNGAQMLNLTDSQDKLVYEMHQYLGIFQSHIGNEYRFLTSKKDESGSGSCSDCVNPHIGTSRLSDATAWLRLHNRRGIISEYAGGNNSICMLAVTNMLKSMAASRVWLGAIWWTAGPGAVNDTMFSMEPPNGIAFQEYLPLIMPLA